MHTLRLLLLPLVTMLSGCLGPSILDQVRQARTFTKCEFRLVSVERTTLAGVAIQGKTALSEVGPLDALKLAAALKGGPLPLTFTLQVEAKNPNTDPAAMNRFQWKLFVDSEGLTAGSLEDRVEIGPNGGLATLPLAVTVDLRAALPGRSRDALVNLAFNVAGAGAHPTKLTLKATPTILIAGYPMEFPDAITVTTEYGAK